MREALGIVTVLSEPIEVRQLPKGAIVGDQFGGRTFTDNVAAALERRSYRGWLELSDGNERWTLITIEC